MKNKLLLSMLLILVILALGWIGVQAQAASALQVALQNPNLDPQARASLEEKLEMEQRIQQDKQTGEANAAPKQPGTPPDLDPQITSDSSLPSGIIEGGTSLIHSYEAIILNHWQDMPEGRITQVFAGYTPDDPEQGILYVVVWIDDAPRKTHYLTPSHDGGARITAVEEGLLLRVETSGGSAWLFDWRSGEFQ